MNPFTKWLKRQMGAVSVNSLVVIAEATGQPNVTTLLGAARKTKKALEADARKNRAEAAKLNAEAQSDEETSAEIGQALADVKNALGK